MARDYQYDIMPEIKARFAVRNFTEDAVPLDDLLAMADAARFAPSCYNEQPWRFVLLETPEKREKLSATVVSGNAWAKDAPALALVAYKKTFTYNGKPNAYAAFDAGCASGFFQLEAVRRGYAVHFIAGFDQAAARAAFQIGDDFEIMGMLVIGKPVDQAHWDEKPRNRQSPGERKPLDSFILGS